MKKKIRGTEEKGYTVDPVFAAGFELYFRAEQVQEHRVSGGLGRQDRISFVRILKKDRRACFSIQGT